MDSVLAGWSCGAVAGALSLKTLLPQEGTPQPAVLGPCSVCPQAGQQGVTPRVLQVSFFLNWNRTVPSPLFQLLGAGEGAAGAMGALLPER